MDLLLLLPPPSLPREVSRTTLNIGVGMKCFIPNFLGAVYEFQYSNGNWTQTSIITDSNVVAGDWFGDSIALDGDIAAAGAPYHAGQGSAYVFQRTGAGSAWTRVAELMSSKASRGEQFGSALDVSGKRIIVGAEIHNDGLKAYSGAFSIFEEVSAGSWKEVLTTVPDLAKIYSMCGSSVAIEGDFAFVACGTDSQESSINNYAGSCDIYIYFFLI